MDSRYIKVHVLTFDGAKFVESDKKIKFSDIKSIERQTYYNNHLFVKMTNGESITIKDDFEFININDNKSSNKSHYTSVSYGLDTDEDTHDSLLDITFGVSNQKSITYHIKFGIFDPDIYHSIVLFEELEVDSNSGVVTEKRLDESIALDFPEILSIQARVNTKLSEYDEVKFDGIIEDLQEFISKECCDCIGRIVGGY